MEQTFKSISNQPFINWEWIIIDDGSSAESSVYTQSLSNNDRRILFLIRNREPKGASTCRNVGFKNASGDYVIFLDSDDLLAPHCLEQRVKVMEENPDLDFAVFPMLIFKDKPEEAEYLWNIETQEDDLERFLRLDAVWQTTGPIWRKSALEKIGGFTEGLHCWQDVDLHLKALFTGLKYQKFYNLPPDCYYRRHSEGSISQGRINTPEKLQSRREIFEFAYLKISEKTSTDKNTLFTSIRYMQQGILISSIRVGSWSFFFKSFFRGKTVKLLTFSSTLKVLTICVIYFLRLYKMAAIQRYSDYVASRLTSHTTIGKCRYE